MCIYALTYLFTQCQSDFSDTAVSLSKYFVLQSRFIRKQTDISIGQLIENENENRCPTWGLKLLIALPLYFGQPLMFVFLLKNETFVRANHATSAFCDEVINIFAGIFI